MAQLDSSLQFSTLETNFWQNPQKVKAQKDFCPPNNSKTNQNYPVITEYLFGNLLGTIYYCYLL